MRSVTESVLWASETLLLGFRSSNVCMSPLLGLSTGSGLWTIPIVASRSWFVLSTLRHGWQSDKSGVQRFLLNRKLIVEPPTTCNPLESFANESTSGEWSEEGNRLLNHREYEEAIMAFDNAGDVYMTAVAVAYQSREIARDVPESQTRHRREAFVNAAGAFEHCAEIAKSPEEERTHYAAAARCYAEIKYHQDAVRALKLASMFTEAASYCFDNNLLDTAVSIIKRHKADVDLQTTHCIKEVARLSYLESKDLE